MAHVASVSLLSSGASAKRVQSLGAYGQQEPYLDTKRMQKNGPTPLKPAQKAVILHTFGVQVEEYST